MHVHECKHLLHISFIYITYSKILYCRLYKHFFFKIKILIRLFSRIAFFIVYIYDKHPSKKIWDFEMKFFHKVLLIYRYDMKRKIA